MVQSVTEIYQHTIRPLPAPRRFELATMILSEISPQSVADAPYDWEEEDEETEQAAWRALSLQSLARAYEGEEDSAMGLAEESGQGIETKGRRET
jgi:hypothetical protein